jgi:hypothetical protein
VVQAYSDNREAVDELQVIGENPIHRFHIQGRGIVESLSRNSISLFTNDILENKLQGLEYAEILHYYRQTPQVDSVSVIFGVDRNKYMTEEEKTDFMAIVIHTDPSFRVAQRACLLVKPWLEKYQQAKPVDHAGILSKCKVYGKVWGF